MKNLLLVLIILFLLFLIFNIPKEKYDDKSNDKSNDDEFLKIKKQKQDELVSTISQIINYTHKCPSDSDPVFACNRTYETTKNEDKEYCSRSTIAKFICDLSNNSYKNAKYILHTFGINEQEQQKINNLINNCYIDDKVLGNPKCIDNRNKCINKLLTCIFDKTYFARHRPLDEFKIVYNQAYNDCISNSEIISNKYAFSCNNLI